MADKGKNITYKFSGALIMKNKHKILPQLLLDVVAAPDVAALATVARTARAAATARTVHALTKV